MLYECRAPLRIDFGGGWTDVPIFAEAEGGAVLNAAITVYVRGALSRPSAEGWLATLRGDRSSVRYSLDAPSGAGLGSSAAQTVLWAALIRASIDNSADRAEIAEIACKIKDALGIVGGKQDEYASALGGIRYYTFTDSVDSFQLGLESSFVRLLKQRLVLAYTGTSRVSSTIHSAVWDRFRAGDKTIVDALRALKQIAEQMKQALEEKNLDAFGALLTDNWRYQQALHPSVSNPRVSDVMERASRYGALGGKACGAGGGGCVVFLARSGEEDRLRQALRNDGLRTIDFDFDTYGVYLNKG